MRREGSFRERTKRLLDDSIHAGRLLAGRHDGALQAYQRLLWQVQTQTDLLHPSDRHGDNRNLLNAGLLALSLHHADWLQPVETWFPSRQNAWPLFTSLTHHLLALYPVPAFMTSVWFDLPSGEILPQHGWYKLLGQGRNIRTASRALLVEGQAMRHCVATYAERCTRRQTSIWSMQVENQRGRHRVLTIELDLLTRTICQARKKCNQLPRAIEREVMVRWAAQEGLKVGESVRL